MYKYLLESGANINWMAIFALVTFVLIFLISVAVVFGRSKDFVDRMANLPLDEEKSVTELSNK